MNIRYDARQGLPEEPTLTSLLDLLTTTFADQSRSEFLTDLTYNLIPTPALALLAFDGQRVVGCKMGYEQNPRQFYSWLGCVDPAYRGAGIATELMRRQHDWCRTRGYATIRTHTYNQWRSMLILNLRHGFDIIGTVQGKRGLSIVLEKRL